MADAKIAQPQIHIKAWHEYVEQGVIFFLKPPATSRSPKNQNGTMAKDALLLENVISAECVR